MTRDVLAEDAANQLEMLIEAHGEDFAWRDQTLRGVRSRRVEQSEAREDGFTTQIVEEITVRADKVQGVIRENDPIFVDNRKYSVAGVTHSQLGAGILIALKTAQGSR